MQNEPIVLCDEVLADLHGGDAITDLSNMTQAIDQIGQSVIWAIGQVPSWVGAALSYINAALGPTGGSYNPYSNPINCEYGFY